MAFKMLYNRVLEHYVRAKPTFRCVNLETKARLIWRGKACSHKSRQEAFDHYVEWRTAVEACNREWCMNHGMELERCSRAGLKTPCRKL